VPGKRPPTTVSDFVINPTVAIEIVVALDTQVTTKIVIAILETDQVKFPSCLSKMFVDHDMELFSRIKTWQFRAQFLARWTGEGDTGHAQPLIGTIELADTL